MIDFFTEQIDFQINNKDVLIQWIKNTAKEENRKTGEISIIFTSDDNLLEINKKYLNHDYYTDVITFDYSENDTISGDIFISIDRVKENAQIYNSKFEQELHRVIIHGILHLIGYKDKNETDQKLMRQKEDYYLQKLEQL